MDKLSNLSSSRYTFTQNHLTFSDFITFDEWSDIVENLKMMKGAVHFWIGDALNFGESKFGEEYAQVFDIMDFELGTLKNDKWVAGRIPVSRRRDSLPFSHHQEVADLTPEEQDKMLDYAVEKNLNRSDFRKVVRNYKLKLDLPELTDEELQGSSVDFDKITELVGKIIEVTDQLKALDMDSLDKNARDFLLSQMKKSFGYMGGVLNKYERG